MTTKLTMKRPTLPLPFPDTPPEWITKKPVVKAGVVTPEFGHRRKRQAQLVARLKQRRKYGVPVKGGTGKHSKNTPSKQSRKHFG